MAMALSPIAILGTAAGLLTVAVLTMWLGGAVIFVAAIVAAASGWVQHPSTYGKSETLLCKMHNFFLHLLSAEGELPPINAPPVEYDEPPKAEHKPSPPINRLRDNSRETCCCFRMAFLRNLLLSKPSKKDIATPVGPAGTSNPCFFEWSAGMSFKIEVNEIENLNPHKQPIGSVALAKGVGLQVVNAGARGSDVSLVIAPCGVDGEVPTACLLKGIKGRRTPQVTETDHLLVHTSTGTKERRSTQGGLGLWFHSKWNRGDVVASQNPSEGMILKATSLPIRKLSAIFPEVLRFGILKPDTLQAPEEVRFYCYYENRPLRILQVLMQLVPCAEGDAGLA